TPAAVRGEDIELHGPDVPSTGSRRRSRPTPGESTCRARPNCHCHGCSYASPLNEAVRKPAVERTEQERPRRHYRERIEERPKAEQDRPALQLAKVEAVEQRVHEIGRRLGPPPENQRAQRVTDRDCRRECHAGAKRMCHVRLFRVSNAITSMAR